MMRKPQSKAKAGGQPVILALFKGALVASALSVILLAAAAYLLYKGMLQSDSVSLLGAGIKVVSAALAALIVIRGMEHRRFFYGALAGLVYIVLAFLVFSVISGTFGISLALLSDIGIGILSGALTALGVSLFNK